jgi:enamine deaminase RidA (YjgF/YER057c/UK114 family)
VRKSVTALLILVLCPALWPEPQRKKKGSEEEITQTREVYEDPPAVITAPTDRLSFHVAPLSGKGLLSQQVRDALKALFRDTRGASIVKLRGFVAGTGDLRRVQAIVSETFTDKRLTIPALSVVQVGAIPLEGAQLVLESVSVAKKPTSPHGWAFLSGQQVSSDNADPKITPLVQKSLAQLRTVLGAAKLQPGDVERATCLVSSLEDYPQARGAVAAEFPSAAITIVQLQRIHLRGLVECEAVARLKSPPAAPVEFLNPDGLPRATNYSQAALVSAPKLAFTSLRMAFQGQENDIRLAFQRLEKDLQGAKASPKTVVMSNIYPLTRPTQDLVSKLRFEFYDRTKPPASTMVLFEGLPSLDAYFGVEVIAVAE